MLTPGLAATAAVVARVGEPVVPQGLAGAWNADPVVVTGLLLAGWAYARGRAGGRRGAGDIRRARYFGVAIVVLGAAFVSPLDALSHALASAHMVQHLLVVLVAAPLLALSGPAATLLRGSPRVVRRALSRSLKRSGGRSRRPRLLTSRSSDLLRHPGTVWLVHAATLWFWHAAVPYDAALRHGAVHAIEHGTFLVTGVLFWRVVISPRSAVRVSRGLGVLLVFAMGLQSVFLSLLLTFARDPWYAGYAATTRPWGLEPLADQQLAGVIMWVPAGLVYLAAALSLVVAWVRETDEHDLHPGGLAVLEARGNSAAFAPGRTRPTRQTGQA